MSLQSSYYLLFFISCAPYFPLFTCPRCSSRQSYYRGFPLTYITGISQFLLIPILLIILIHSLVTSLFFCFLKKRLNFFIFIIIFLIFIFTYLSSLQLQTCSTILPYLLPILLILYYSTVFYMYSIPDIPGGFTYLPPWSSYPWIILFIDHTLSCTRCLTESTSLSYHFLYVFLFLYTLQLPVLAAAPDNFFPILFLYILSFINIFLLQIFSSPYFSYR